MTGWMLVATSRVVAPQCSSTLAGEVGITRVEEPSMEKAEMKRRMKSVVGRPCGGGAKRGGKRLKSMKS